MRNEFVLLCRALNWVELYLCVCECVWSAQSVPSECLLKIYEMTIRKGRGGGGHSPQWEYVKLVCDQEYSAVWGCVMAAFDLSTCLCNPASARTHTHTCTQAVPALSLGIFPSTLYSRILIFFTHILSCVCVCGCRGKDGVEEMFYLLLCLNLLFEGCFRILI